jgi:drug/metabolite transporter (DMT)-like permease
MIALLFSIVCSSLLFVLFKLFPKWKIDTFQAIVFNYFVAFIAGFALYGNEWKDSAMNAGAWPGFALLAGFLFITLFLLMGSSSQQNGVGKTSIAVKMSMAMSMLLMMIWYNEHITFLKILGIGLALVGVILVSKQDSQKSAKNGSGWMLIVLFVGSGLLDFVLNYVQKYELDILTPSLFSSIGFGCAGIMGLCVLIYKLIQKKITFHWRNVLAGILLGIPNYFSIYLLLHAYSSTGWNDSTVLAITNVSVVVFSSLMGYFIFKETLTRIKLIGALVAISALIILYFANGSH